MTDYFGLGCHGRGAKHCCHLGSYGVCQYLEEYTVEGRRWACGLFREQRELDALADSATIWQRVYTDDRYIVIEAQLRDAGYPTDYRCGDYPQDVPQYNTQDKGKCCYSCDVQPEYEIQY